MWCGGLSVWLPRHGIANRQITNLYSIRGAKQDHRQNATIIFDSIVFIYNAALINTIFGLPLNKLLIKFIIFLFLDVMPIFLDVLLLDGINKQSAKKVIIVYNLTMYVVIFRTIGAFLLTIQITVDSYRNTSITYAILAAALIIILIRVYALTGMYSLHKKLSAIEKERKQNETVENV